MPQTTNYGFPLLADTPPEGMTGKDLRDMILGEDETSLAQMMDAELKKIEEQIPAAQVQADWAQTDVSKPDYIRNKPTIISKLPNYAKVAGSGNYNDLGCKPYGEITILPEESFFFGVGLGVDGCYVPRENDGVLLQARDELVPGEQYVVVWDGMEYILTAGYVNDFCKNYNGALNFDGMVYVGNQARFFGGIIGGTPVDSGEPFIIITMHGTGVIIHTNTADQHTVSVAPVNRVRKIDRQYLPDELVTTEEMAQQLAEILPAFSAADNGKVLGIQNGRLAWVTVQISGGGGAVEASVDGNTLVLGDGASADGNALVLNGDASVDGSTLILGG